MKKIVLIFFFFSSPLFATPKDDFANVLKLAKFSSCEDIAYKFDALSNFDGFGKLVEKELQKKTENLFPWRADVTNGYKEGFFYYALLGYASEISGDIPFAYQCYRNATLYIDEKKSFNFPEPTAEIYLGIARACLAVGRYMDTKNWLDTAYEYANENPKILSAIDRVAIQKGNELGDYKDIILHYQHLEQLAGRQKTEDRERTTDYGLRITKLTKPEIANYAQILFYSRKDREGFSKLLEGISTLGIDNNLGVKDPLVNKFLNNIMRADNEEVEYIYDLLGYEIEAARAKAGDENYLAFLCNARTLFCKVYDFLDPEDDLKKVKKRIDKVKKQLKQGYDVFGNEKRLSVISNQLSVNKKIIKSQNRVSKSGEIVGEVPEVELENLLMQADWQFKNKTFSNALTNYLMSSELATGAFANLEYDGTTTKNMAIMGLLKINLKTQAKAVNSYNSNFEFDNSFRSADLTLQLYQTVTNDNHRTVYNTETAIAILPKAYPATLDYLRKEAIRLTKNQNYEKAIKIYKKYEKRKGMLVVKVAKKYAAILFHLGKDKTAFSTVLKSLNSNRSFFWREIIQNTCFQTWCYASNADLQNYYNSILPAKIELKLAISTPRAPICNAPTIVELINWQNNCYRKEKKVREVYHKGNYQNVIKLLSDKQKELTPVQLIKKGIAYSKLEKPNDAIDCFLEAMKKNEAIFKNLSSDNCFYHKEEIQLIIPLLKNVSTNKVFACYRQLSKLKNKLLIAGNTKGFSQIEKIINNNTLLSKFTKKTKK